MSTDSPVPAWHNEDATSLVASEPLNLRKFEDGDHTYDGYKEQIFVADESHKCPVYVHRTLRARAAVHLEKIFAAGCRLFAVWSTRRER